MFLCGQRKLRESIFRSSWLAVNVSGFQSGPDWKDDVPAFTMPKKILIQPNQRCSFSQQRWRTSTWRSWTSSYIYCRLLGIPTCFLPKKTLLKLGKKTVKYQKSWLPVCSFTSVSLRQRCQRTEEPKQTAQPAIRRSEDGTFYTETPRSCRQTRRKKWYLSSCSNCCFKMSVSCFCSFNVGMMKSEEMKFVISYRNNLMVLAACFYGSYIRFRLLGVETNLPGFLLFQVNAAWKISVGITNNLRCK